MPPSRVPAEPHSFREGSEKSSALGSAAVPVSEIAHVRAILIASARQRRAMNYSTLLDALGHRFSRPNMRALCRTLDAIDTAARVAGEPELAVLVVRASDGLPGQGWWAGERTRKFEYVGPWWGTEAMALVLERQSLAFDYWAQEIDI